MKKKSKPTDESTLAAILCMREGKKSQVKRADMMEIIKHIQELISNEIMYDGDDGDYFVLKVLLKKADQDIKKKK